jgi:ABC-type cobalt transport system substrate-binding protein
MKKKILFGAIFSISIIMLVNTSSALEYKTVTDYNTDLIESKLKNLDIFIEKIRQIIADINIKLSNVESLNGFQNLSDELSELKISYINNPSFHTIFDKLPGNILSLILSLIGTIIGIIYGKIFGSLTVLLVKILTAPAVLLAKIIESITNMLLS